MRAFIAPEPIYPYHEWKIIEERYNEENQLRNESVFALGNGYIGMRGNFEEGFQGAEGGSMNGTFLNGFYESEPIRYPEGAYGYAANSQTMLNVTDAKIIFLEVEGERFSLFSGTVHCYERELDMNMGILIRRVDWESPAGKRVAVTIRRMVCLQRKHLAAIHYKVTPLNFSGAVKLISVIDGEVTNQAAQGDPRMGSVFSGRVLHTEALDIEAESAWVKQHAKNSGFTLVAAIGHDVQTAGSPFRLTSKKEDQRIVMTYELDAVQGQAVSMSKFMSYHTSKDYPENELGQRTDETLRSAKEAGFDSLLREQSEFLQRFWHRTDVEIEGDPALQQGIRYNMFQLLQSAGRDGKTSIGAKGLTGEGYEGHYFWDTETYILPFFTYTNPEIARALLAYRCGILDKARERAKEMSQKGALYPWRTINGEETSAYYPAGTAQVHINADIVYGLKKYVNAAGDSGFLLREGAEMAFETARFYADLGYYNERREGRFCIDAVTGPDEYTAVIDNNAYTNVMAKDHLEFACRTADWMKSGFPEEYRLLAEKIELSEAEISGWKQAAEMMFIPYDEQLGIIAQDDTFLMKQKWDFENTPDDKYPLLLHFHPLVIYRHQVLKQADVVLALFLQGNRFSLAEKIRNYRYYEPLTTHDSSLSPCTHSIIAVEIGNTAQACDYFNRTARMDLDDINRNVKDGLHMASLAGSWLSIVNGFAGMRDYGGDLHFNPTLPGQWQGYRFKISYQGRLIDIHVDREKAAYTLVEGEPLTIVHFTSKIRLVPGVAQEISLKKRLEAVIFDLDGVITDTAEYHYLAWKQLADELGLLFDRKVNERLKGVSRKASLDILLAQGNLALTGGQKQELAARKNQYYKKWIERITPKDLLPGIEPLLHDLRQGGVRLAIASASENAPTVLGKLKIADLFDVVVDPKTIAKGKPDPEIFLAAADLLQVRPEHCVGVEDSAAGIIAIKAANMPAIGIGTRDQLQQADLVMARTEELTTEVFKQLIENGD